MQADDQPPLYLQPADSLQLRLWIMASHAVAALVTLFLPVGMPWWGKLLLLVAIGVSTRHFWRLHVSRTHSQAVREVTFYSIDNCLLRTPDGSRFTVLDDSSFLHPWLCSLNFRSRKGCTYTLLLTTDNSSQETRRRLRVRVKFSAPEPVADKRKAFPAQGKASNQ